MIANLHRSAIGYNLLEINWDHIKRLVNYDVMSDNGLKFESFHQYGLFFSFLWKGKGYLFGMTRVVFQNVQP